MSGFESQVITHPPLYETRVALCFGHPENELLFWSIGGIMGMVVAGIPLAVLRKHKIIVIGIVPHIIANALTGSMEMFVHEWYIQASDVAAMVASLPMMAALMALLVRYSFAKVKHDAPQSARWEQHL